MLSCENCEYKKRCEIFKITLGIPGKPGEYFVVITSLLFSILRMQQLLWVPKWRNFVQFRYSAISAVTKHRGQTFAHARVVGAELSAPTKTEEKYISGRLHKAPEKRINKITRG